MFTLTYAQDISSTVKYPSTECNSIFVKTYPGKYEIIGDTEFGVGDDEVFESNNVHFYSKQKEIRELNDFNLRTAYSLINNYDTIEIIFDSKGITQFKYRYSCTY
jgi:hypothetical protein